MKMTLKEQLYYLINNYFSGKYNAEAFCDQFPLIYREGLDYSDKNEKEMMESFCELAKRYSPFEEDVSLYDFYIGDAEFNEKFMMLYKRYLGKP